MMIRFYDKTAWLLSSMGIALLVCGLVLVPQSRLVADDPTISPTISCVFDCNCDPVYRYPNCPQARCNLGLSQCTRQCKCVNNSSQQCECTEVFF
jgi:hypothetical protein